MNRRKSNISPWYRMGLATVLSAACLVTAIGTAYARYAGDKVTGNIGFAIRGSADVHLGTLDSEGNFLQEESAWQETDGKLQLAFALSNGTGAEDYAQGNQKVVIRVVGSLGAWVEQSETQPSQETTEPQDTTETQETTEPQETDETDDTTAVTETEPSATETISGVAANPAAAEETAQEQPEEESHTSTETEVPTETTVPTETEAPTETTVPAETEAPTETTIPAETEVPAETTAPTETTLPTETEPTAQTQQPAQNEDNGMLIGETEAGEETVKERTMTITVDGVEYTAEATRISRDSELYAAFGDGWEFRFLDQQGNELCWELEGGKQSCIEVLIAILGTDVQASLLQVQIITEEY